MNCIFISFSCAVAIFSFISELVTSGLRIQKTSDYANPCRSVSKSETLLSPPYLLIKMV